MNTNVCPVQPETQPVRTGDSIDCFDGVWRQREIALLSPLSECKWVDEATVDLWRDYRDAVVWCWINQRHFIGIREKARQAMFASAAGMHPPHASRCLKRDSRAPMELPERCINAFESFTGLRGIRQWQMRQAGLTVMEHVIHLKQRKAA